MIRKIKPEEAQELLITEAPKRGDALTYLEQCIEQGIIPVDVDLCQIADLDLRYLDDLEKRTIETAIEIGEEIELRQQEIKIKNSPWILNFLEEAREIPINEISHTKEKKRLLEDYFLRFKTDGRQPLKLKEEVSEGHPLESLQKTLQDEKKPKTYDELEMRDLFRKVVLFYRKKYDLYLQKKEMPIFLQEASPFIDSEPWRYMGEKQTILEKYFPEEDIEQLRGDYYKIDAMFQKRIDLAERLNLLKNNAF